MVANPFTLMACTSTPSLFDIKFLKVQCYVFIVFVFIFYLSACSFGFLDSRFISTMMILMYTTSFSFFCLHSIHYKCRQYHYLKIYHDKIKIVFVSFPFVVVRYKPLSPSLNTDVSVIPYSSCVKNLQEVLLLTLLCPSKTTLIVWVKYLCSFYITYIIFILTFFVTFFKLLSMSFLHF